jgi:hypothetical protein
VANQRGSLAELNWSDPNRASRIRLDLAIHFGNSCNGGRDTANACGGVKNPAGVDGLRRRSVLVQ